MMVEESSKDVCFLNSGYGNHMTLNKKLFSISDELVQSHLKLGNKAKMLIMGKGAILINTKQG